MKLIKGTTPVPLDQGTISHALMNALRSSFIGEPNNIVLILPLALPLALKAVPAGLVTFDFRPLRFERK
jgi:hypothetical protein